MARFPTQLETARLILRPPRGTDARRLCKAVKASLPELRDWMPWAKHGYGLDEARAFCEGAQRKLLAEQEYSTLVLLKRSHRLVGCCSLDPLDWSVPKFEIGYWLCTNRVGRGYATEAAKGMAEYAFRALGAERLEIRVDDRNARSWAVAERLGFGWEATLTSHERGTDGALRDTRIYALFDVNSLT